VELEVRMSSMEERKAFKRGQRAFEVCLTNYVIPNPGQMLNISANCAFVLHKT
jgi:hypothetical protein